MAFGRGAVHHGNTENFVFHGQSTSRCRARFNAQVESFSRPATSPRRPFESKATWHRPALFLSIVTIEAAICHVDLWFDDLVDGIQFHVFNLLFCSPWPNDFHAIDGVGITQSEVNDP